MIKLANGQFNDLTDWLNEQHILYVGKHDAQIPQILAEEAELVDSAVMNELTLNKPLSMVLEDQQQMIYYSND